MELGRAFRLYVNEGDVAEMRTMWMKVCVWNRVHRIAHYVWRPDLRFCKDSVYEVYLWVTKRLQSILYSETRHESRLVVKQRDRCEQGVHFVFSLGGVKPMMVEKTVQTERRGSKQKHKPSIPMFLTTQLRVKPYEYRERTNLMDVKVVITLLWNWQCLRINVAHGVVYTTQ